MKLETAKTLILIVLIGTSLLLTLGTGSYKPSQKALDNVTIDEVDIGGTEETKKSIIEPLDIILHANGSYYGFKDPAERERLYERMNSWSLSDVTIHSVADRTPNDYEVELIFPENFPVELLGSIFTLADEDVPLPENALFERIYIKFDVDTATLLVEVVTDDGGLVKAKVNDTNDFNHLWAYMGGFDLDTFRLYTLMDEGGKNIYLPTGEIVLPKKTMSFKRIEPPDMRDVLFDTPSVVSESRTPEIGETYFTDSRQMRVDEDGISMEYVNILTGDNNTDNPWLSPTALLDRSILQINNHKGWTSDYRLAELNSMQNLVRYRMYYEGYPIFNRDNMSMIEQVLNSQQLIEYRRPLIILAQSVINETPIELASGEVIKRDIIDNPDYSEDNVQAVTLGYRLKIDTDFSYNENVELEPVWYIKYNGRWTQHAFNEPAKPEGGD
ncbi:YycH family regulatory protein [Oceanobacillus polygoni]|uniref:Regulatory protein YycH of two-component signal transduction system YycFG n=1 Tax=Oceanobacillus polygoni TaxID=1235259 RepID=A0A9X1CH72_9BACI|nr:two-component system activity regulator YycH [Oceanobacillus polygoni]MBP2078640.1 regulatory protein YycH of two-component signal transduction system YycFG [Oceanobacillus polygoni]